MVAAVAEYVYRDANGEPYLLVRKYLDGDGKKQFPQFHWDGTQWVKGKPAGSKIPYRLPELLAAPTAVVYFCEGEKDADNLASKACVVATSASEGASAKWVPELTQYFKDRRVVILPDADEPGRKHAHKVAKALYEVAASVKVVDLFPDRSDGHDVTDWLKHDAVGARLFEAIKAATEWEPGDDKPIAAATPEDEALLVELAALSPLDYAKRRKRAAVKLGISVSDLDRFVAPLRDEKKFDKTVMLYAHWQVEPWDEAVDGKILFRALYECVRRYVILTEPQATAVTLWVVYSWLHEHERFATHSPVLLVRSAEKDSGKTTLLGIVTFLTRRALNSVEISGAALFRSIAKWQPTFVIDEGDDVLTDNADLRSVLNSGWTRGQTVVRCHHDTHEPEIVFDLRPQGARHEGRQAARHHAQPVARDRHEAEADWRVDRGFRSSGQRDFCPVAAAGAALGHRQRRRAGRATARDSTGLPQPPPRQLAPAAGDRGSDGREAGRLGSRARDRAAPDRRRSVDRHPAAPGYSLHLR